MSAMEVTPEMLAAKFEAIFPHLDERQRRLLLGAEARALGRGGIRLVARAAGVREATVSLGVDELDSGAGVRQASGLNDKTGPERALVSRTTTPSASRSRPTSTQSVPPFAL